LWEHRFDKLDTILIEMQKKSKPKQTITKSKK